MFVLIASDAKLSFASLLYYPLNSSLSKKNDLIYEKDCLYQLKRSNSPERVILIKNCFEKFKV